MCVRGGGARRAVCEGAWRHAAWREPRALLAIVPVRQDGQDPRIGDIRRETHKGGKRFALHVKPPKSCKINPETPDKSAIDEAGGGRTQERERFARASLRHTNQILGAALRKAPAHSLDGRRARVRAHHLLQALHSLPPCTHARAPRVSDAPTQRRGESPRLGRAVDRRGGGRRTEGCGRALECVYDGRGAVHGCATGRRLHRHLILLQVFG